MNRHEPGRSFQKITAIHVETGVSNATLVNETGILEAGGARDAGMGIADTVPS